MSNSIAELEHAPFILACGTNTTESHPVISLRLKRAVANGTRLVVVDPRRIELTEFADRWLPIKIGTDIALFNAMAHVIIREGLYDKSFIEERTSGFEDLSQFLASHTPERAEEITGIPAQDIIATAREYASAERASIAYTLGMTEHTTGVRNVQSLANLALLTGNLGRRNAGVNPLRGQNNVQGAGDMGCIPYFFPGYQQVKSAEIREAWSASWDVELSAKPGVTKVAALEEMLEGNIRALYIMGENTLVSDANAGLTRRALQATDFLVVQDMFMTETAEMADVVLPAASFAEVDGTFTNSERRVQRIRKAVDPPGDAKPDWQIVMELSQRLGYDAHYDHPSEIWDEVRRNTPVLRGITYERIDSVGLQWPCPTEDHPGTEFLHEGEFVNGRGLFKQIEYPGPAEPTDEQYPLVLTTGRRRSTYHTGTMTRRASGFEQLVPNEWLEVNPQDAHEMDLQDGERVDMVSRRGRVAVRVKITDRSPPGVVFTSFHFPGEVLTNAVTSDLYDPITETPAYKACAVRIEPHREPQPEG